jgi:hypothetical protein
MASSFFLSKLIAQGNKLAYEKFFLSLYHNRQKEGTINFLFKGEEQEL